MLFVVFAAVVAAGVGLGVLLEAIGRWLIWLVWRAQESAKLHFRRGWANLRRPRGPFIVFALCALVMMLACASPPAPAPAVAKEELWLQARITEAHVNGCVEDCPPAKGDRCVDAYGFCWTRCAWERSGHDQHLRELLERAAFEADPTSSFLVTCDQVHGTEALR